MHLFDRFTDFLNTRQRDVWPSKHIVYEGGWVYLGARCEHHTPNGRPCGYKLCISIRAYVGEHDDPPVADVPREMWQLCEIDDICYYENFIETANLWLVPTHMPLHCLEHYVDHRCIYLIAGSGTGVCHMCLSHIDSAPAMICCAEFYCKSAMRAYVECYRAWLFVSRDAVLCADVKTLLGGILATLCRKGVIRLLLSVPD